MLDIMELMGTNRKGPATAIASELLTTIKPQRWDSTDAVQVRPEAKATGRNKSKLDTRCTRARRMGRDMLAFSSD